MWARFPFRSFRTPCQPSFSSAKRGAGSPRGDRVICAKGFPYAGKFRLRRLPDCRDCEAATIGSSTPPSKLGLWMLQSGGDARGSDCEVLQLLRFSPYLPAFLPAYLSSASSPGVANCFSGASRASPKCDRNHRKSLCKRLFRGSAQYRSQSGNVGAMKFGKVPSCTLRAEAMPIIRGMG